MRNVQLLFATALIVTVGCGEQRLPAAGAAKKPVAVAKAGSQFPAYSAVMLDGKPFRIPDGSGRVLLLNIWATWCGPCRYEIPELKALQQQYSGQKFDVIGISVDSEDATGEVREFVKEQQINYPIVLDPSGTVTALLDTTVLPTSALVDRSGKVIWKHIGVVDSRNPELNRALKNAL